MVRVRDNLRPGQVGLSFSPRVISPQDKVVPKMVTRVRLRVCEKSARNREAKARDWSVKSGAKELEMTRKGLCSKLAVLLSQHLRKLKPQRTSFECPEEASPAPLSEIGFLRNSTRREDQNKRGAAHDGIEGVVIVVNGKADVWISGRGLGGLQGRRHVNN